MSSNIAVTSIVGVCDGSKGLRCGNPCDLEEFLGSGNHQCVCDVAYMDQAGTCQRSKYDP